MKRLFPEGQNTILSLLIIPVLAFLFLSGCEGKSVPAVPDQAEYPERLLVGFSQTGTDSPWNISQTTSLMDAAKLFGAELIVTDAGGSTRKQLEDIEYLISLNPDFLIINPREYDNLASSIVSVRNAGIPVILINQGAPGVPGEDYVTLITGDFYEQGKAAGQILIDHFGSEDFNVVEITGISGSSSSLERVMGIRQIQKDYPGFHTLRMFSGNEDRYITAQLMESVIQEYGREIDAVFTHNDQSALGVLQALRAAGKGFIPGKDVIVVSINGERDVLKAIVAGEVLATVENTPKVGVKVFKAIMDYRKGIPQESRIVLSGSVLDRKTIQNPFVDGY